MSTSGRIRVLTVDDHPMLREGIAAVLANEEDMELVAEASNGREAIEQFRINRPDVTLMDVQMPEVNGIDAILKIREEFPDARIIVLTCRACCNGSDWDMRAPARATFWRRRAAASHRALHSES